MFRLFSLTFVLLTLRHCTESNRYPPVQYENEQPVVICQEVELETLSVFNPPRRGRRPHSQRLSESDYVPNVPICRDPLPDIRILFTIPALNYSTILTLPPLQFTTPPSLANGEEYYDEYYDETPSVMNRKHPSGPRHPKEPSIVDGDYDYISLGNVAAAFSVNWTKKNGSLIMMDREKLKPGVNILPAAVAASGGSDDGRRKRPWKVQTT